MAAFDERYEADVEEIEDNEDTQKDKYITFLLGEEEYAIEIQYVNEIIGMQKFTHIPDMPDFVRGVIKLRNSVYPVVDVRKRFRMDEIKYGERTCIIIVTIGDTTLGLIVDSVNEVLDILEHQIDPPPKTNSKAKNQFIKGIGKVGERVKIILDIDKAFSDDELSNLTGF
jgi:purine-binding chemotaxis protein CheW